MDEQPETCLVGLVCVEHIFDVKNWNTDTADLADEHGFFSA